jgi:RHS repeat-associated protein
MIRETRSTQPGPDDEFAACKRIRAASNAETHDALDRRVEQYNGSAYTEIVYGPAGNKMALMSTQTVSKLFTPLSAGATAVYNSSGPSYFRHPDWLGSSRIASTPGRTLYYDGAYAPFGENCAETGTTDRNFTGQNQDLTPGSTGLLYDFLYREQHSTQGRWISPDPAGVNAVDPTNPQSWNRYAYVSNMPLNSVDPVGLLRYPWQWGDNCTIDGVSSFCGALGYNGLATLPFGIGSVTSIAGGFAFASVGPDNSISYTYSFDAYYNGVPLSDAALTETLGLPTSASSAGVPGQMGQGVGGGSAGGAGSACTSTILSAVNGQFGTNFTEANVTSEFQFSAGTPQGQGTLNLNVSGNGVSPGRYPVSWWTYIIGYGSTLHIPASPGGLDSLSTLVFSSSQFTAHLDSAFPYNPLGALIHLLIDVKGIGGYKACP